MLERDGWCAALVGRGDSRAARLWDIACRGISAMRASDVVVVDVFGWRAFVLETLAILYARLFDRRTIVIFRGGYLPDFVRAWPLAARWVLRQPALRLAPHAFLAEELGALGITVDAIVPNVIDLDAYKYVERSRLRPRFLYLRGTHSIYDPETCLRAFAIIQSRHPHASLTMAAAGSLDRCRALAGELGLRNVGFPGMVPKADVPRLADAHDIYFQANRVENMPVTILEMWACGLPVVGTTAGGTPYLVRDGEDGLLVAPGDSEALAAACCRLLDHPALALRLTRAGRARAEQLTWERIGPRWHEILSLVAPRPGNGDPIVDGQAMEKGRR